MKKNKAKTVRSYFDHIALKYDMMNTLLSFGIHFFWKRKAIKAGRLKAGDRVIDLCGGTADLSIAAGKIVSVTGNVVLYDFSREMMAAGTAKIRKAGLSKIVLPVCGDAQMISFPQNSFNTAFIGFGLRNLTDIEKGLKEIYRILKPGCCLVCLEFSEPVTPWFRKLYNLYSSCILPLAGKIITGSEEAYTYLHDSIRAFPLPDQLADMMKKAGFKTVTYKRLSNGIAAIHLAVK